MLRAGKKRGDSKNVQPPASVLPSVDYLLPLQLSYSFYSHLKLGRVEYNAVGMSIIHTAM